MANGTGIVTEVKDMLKEDRAISTKSALRMTLAMQVELHKVVKDLGDKVTENSKRLDKVEGSSIVMWMQRHPKLAVLIAGITVVVATLIDLRVVIAKALGIDI